MLFRLRVELDELKEGPKNVPTEEKKNTDKFLALALPPSHDKGRKTFSSI